MLRLSSGEYFGDVLHRACLLDSPLTMTAYPPGHSYPWHVHETPTLFVLLAGQHHDETRHTSFDQSPLSVVFHPTEGPHATSVGPAGMVGINLELTDAWLNRCQLTRGDLTLDYRLLDSLEVRLLVLRLAASAYTSVEAADAEVETIALELVACLIRGVAAQTARAPRWLPQAEEFLRANALTSVRLSHLADELGLHPVYCARAFRQALGCTVTAYHQGLRLVEAGRLVLDGRCGLAEVALRVGFADQAHLTRICSRTLGFTPGRLQRMRQDLFPSAAGSNRSRTTPHRSVHLL